MPRVNDNRCVTCDGEGFPNGGPACQSCGGSGLISQFHGIIDRLKYARGFQFPEIPYYPFPSSPYCYLMPDHPATCMCNECTPAPNRLPINPEK